MFKNVYVENKGEYGSDSVVHIWGDGRHNDAGHVELPYGEFNYAFKKDPNGNYTSLFGDKVSKTYQFGYTSKGLFESDVTPETRVILDKYLHDDEPAEGTVTLFYDIEVTMEGQLPDPMTGNNEITSIAYTDSATREEVCLILDKEGLLENTEFQNAKIFPFTDEESMLLYFIEQWESIAPDIITGWNSDGFDVPYLYNRLKRVLGVDEANRLSPIGIVKYSKKKDKYTIAGVSSLDYMRMYKTFTYNQEPSYRLDAIGKKEVNMGKVEYEGNLDSLFHTDKEKFIEYNLTDVRILTKLDDKLKFIELVRGICTVGHVPYENFNYSSRYIEGTILAYLHRKGIVAPNKPDGGREKMDEMKASGEKGFEGAFVKPPIAGKYDWVYSLDLTSLYPSIIMSLNISPEAKIGFIENWNIDDHIKGKIDVYKVTNVDKSFVKELNKKEFTEFMDETKYGISSNGVLYRDKKDKIGIIPEILDVWFQERLEFQRLLKKAIADGDKEKEEFYDKRQHIQKIFLNSIYGLLGLPVFRFYDLDNAMAVTVTGQDVIKTSAKYLNSLYHTETGNKEEDYVVYVDTDSIYASSLPFLSEDEDKKKGTIAVARKMEKLLNKFYDEFAKRFFNIEEHRFKIKGESVAKSAFWLAKKRYALLKVYDLEKNKDIDKLKVTGIDVVRSDFAPAFRKFMEQILLDILNNVPKEEIDKKILDFKEEIKKKDILQIAKSTAVNDISGYNMDTKKDKKSLLEFKSKTPAHVKASITYNRLLTIFKTKRNTPIQDGDKIKWVYLKDNPLMVSELAFKGYNDPKEIMDMLNEYIDYDKIFDSAFKKKLESFYAALSWGKISTEINQNADRFFSL